MDQRELYTGIVQFIVLLLSLSVHESAHAWSADRLGDPTARYLGRVSLNPIVHADLFGTIIFPIIGLFSGVMFGWAKPVPVNVSRLRNPLRDHMLVAAAGPASNVVMASIFFVMLMAVKASSVEASAIVRDVALFDVPQADAKATKTFQPAALPREDGLCVVRASATNQGPFWQQSALAADARYASETMWGHVATGCRLE